MGLKKTFRVSWASAPNLCQVKHFLQEDCPSKVGRGSQHHHRSKQSHLSSIRPSFGGRSCLKQPKETRPYNPQAKWKCPPKFNLNGNWCVVAGEESKEAEAQNHRVKRVLEAVYPSRSAIPSNPITSVDLDKSYDDSRTQVIPSIPIEEVTDVEVSCHLTPSHNTCSELSDPCPPNSSSSNTCQNLMIPPSNSTFSSKQPAPSRCQVSPKPPVNDNPLPQYSSTCENLHLKSNQISLKPIANGIDVPQCQSNENPSVPLVKRPKTQICSNPPANEKPVVEIADGLDGNTALAAAASVIALAKSKEPSSLIDADFLIKLLSNPEQIQRLMNEHGLASNMKTESKPIGGCDDKKFGDTNSQAFSLPSEVRNTNKQRQTADVDLLTPLCVTKPGKPVNKHQGIKTLALPTPDLSLERFKRFKKLINEYGAPDNVSSDMLVSPRANLPIASQPELQRKLYSQPALSFPLMTSPAPLHKDDNYYKSLIKQHGKNCESSEQLLQNTNLLNAEHCNFFTSPTGCLNGSSSSFLHKLSKQWRPGEMVQAPASKKMKLDGELTGWT